MKRAFWIPERIFSEVIAVYCFPNILPTEGILMRFLLIMSIFLLNACQNNIQTDAVGRQTKGYPAHGQIYTKKHDSAPKGPIPKSFAQVKPQYEPYSRYGNRATYTLDGKQYSVLPSASNYKAQGIASWYGTKFHRMRTSSGDIYNMYAMTAAHRTLPLPSYARVKNLENGREIVVRINDRGPFRHDRLIDLSYGAAAKLGLLPHGTARVEVQALVPVGTKPANYYVQAGAFFTEKQANILRQQITKFTRSPVHVEKHLIRYLVTLGPFRTQRQSDVMTKQLEKHGVHGVFAYLQ